MRAFVRAPGVLLEPMGALWAAFSALSGESHLLNDASAAIVEVANPERPQSLHALCEILASDSGLSAAEVVDSVGMGWDQLVAAGLIREQELDLATAL